MLMQVAGEGLGAAGNRGVGERIADAAKVDEEILSPRRPVRTKQSKKVQFVLDAASDRKPGLAVGERCAAARSLREALLDLPKRAAGGRIEQGRPDRIAEPATHRTKPGQLLVDRGAARVAAEVHAGQISAAGAGLDIGVDAHNPASKLPIVPDDATAVETAGRQEKCLGVLSRDDERAVIAAEAVTERAADKQACPIVGWCDGRGLVR